MTELSFRYSPDNDPNICHMAGMALLEKLESAWKTLLTSGSPVSSNEIAEYRHDFYKAADFFDMTTEYGQPDYGIPVKLRLYYRYLEFIYAVKEVKDHREARQKLNDFEYGILGEFAELLDDAEAYSEIDEFAAERVKSYRERYEAKILCGDYGSAVEYYQNKVDKLQGSGAITEYEKALKTLVFVRIRRARNDAPNGPFYMGMKDSALVENKFGYKMCVGTPEAFSSMKNVLLEAVKTADNMLVAYERVQSGTSDRVILNAYSHGDIGRKEYQNDRKRYVPR